MGLPSDSAVKNPPAMQETQVQPLGQEDPLEEGMATQPTENPMDRGAGRLQSIGFQRVRHDRSD